VLAQKHRKLQCVWNLTVLTVAYFWLPAHQFRELSVLFRALRHVLPCFSTCPGHPRGGQSPRPQIKDHNHTFRGKELAAKLGSSAEVNGCRGRREFQLSDSKSAGELRMSGRTLSNQPLIRWLVFKQCPKKKKRKIEAEFTGIQAHLNAS